MRLQPSIAISALALFIALGGTSYAVGTKISGSQLKNRSVAGVKLERHTVTGADIDVSTFPRVPAAASATHAATAGSAGEVTGTVAGSQVNGPVASATTATDAAQATNATNAVNATNAANAANAASATSATAVDGHSFDQIDASAGSGSAATLLNDVNGLTLECVGPSGASGTVDLELVNDTSQVATFGASAVGPEGAVSSEGSAAAAIGGTVETTTFPLDINSSAQVSFAYKVAMGSDIEVVSGTFTLLLDNGCSAFGNADISSAAS